MDVAQVGGSSLVQNSFGSHQYSGQYKPHTPNNKDLPNKCLVCMHALVKTTPEWQQPIFNTIEIGFDPQVDRRMQETLYNVFPEIWKKRAV